MKYTRTCKFGAITALTCALAWAPVEQSAHAAIIVRAHPPALRAEVVPARPHPGWVWRPGYWRWGGHWIWAGGYWVAPPYVDAVWVPGHWVHRPWGWVWVPGHWA